MLTQGRPVRDVLVIHPIASAWGLNVPGCQSQYAAVAELDRKFASVIRTLSNHHYDWDFGDESLLARHAKCTPKGLKVGQMSYSAVVVPPCRTLRRTTVKLLKRFLDGGGKVLFAGTTPDRLDGAPAGGELDGLIGAARTCADDPAALVSALEGLLPRRVSITEGGAEQTCAWAMLRKVPGGQLLFVQSHDRKAPHDVQVSVAGRGKVVLWDAMTGRRCRLPSRDEDGRVSFELHLPPTGSALVSLGVPVADAAPRPKPAHVVRTERIDGPWDIELTEPNTMPLDYCRVRFGEGEFSQPVPTLKADKIVRERFGLAPRHNHGHQPWYLYATGVVDTAPRGPVEMKWTFHVTDLPRRCALAVEAPDSYRITVNGAAVGAAEGFWVDQEIRTIDVTGLLRAGDNEVVLAFDYRPDMELEDLYLVGEFGVARREGQPPRPGAWTVVKPPTRLRAGSWVGQGLDFYGGTVRYRMEVRRGDARGRVRVRLPEVSCTAAAVHAGGQTFFLPWAPMEADVTDALADGPNTVVVEVFGGRKNTLGPLHVPRQRWTGPGEFDPDNAKWTDEYLLTDHGLMGPVVVETLGE